MKSISKYSINHPRWQIQWDSIRKNENKIVTLGIIGVTLLVVISLFLQREPQDQGADSPDTYIPPGHVLVPIELANGDALSSIVSDFAIVDLFETGRQGTQVKKQVGRKLRLIRAPLNPGKMAVLVPESQAQLLLQNENPLFAVVQNRSDLQQGKIHNSKPAASRIHYNR